MTIELVLAGLALVAFGYFLYKKVTAPKRGGTDGGFDKERPPTDEK